MGTQMRTAVLLPILFIVVGLAPPAFAEEDGEEPKETVEQIEKAQRLGKKLKSRNKLEVTDALRMLGGMKTPTATEFLMDYVLSTPCEALAVLAMTLVSNIRQDYHVETYQTVTREFLEGLEIDQKTVAEEMAAYVKALPKKKTAGGGSRKKKEAPSE